MSDAPQSIATLTESQRQIIAPYHAAIATAQDAINQLFGFAFPRCAITNYDLGSGAVYGTAVVTDTEPAEPVVTVPLQPLPSVSPSDAEPIDAEPITPVGGEPLLTVAMDGA